LLVKTTFWSAWGCYTTTFAMDYEKPEAVSPRVYPHHEQVPSVQPDADDTLHGSEDAAPPEERRKPRGDSLW